VWFGVVFGNLWFEVSSVASARLPCHTGQHGCGV